jgi:hypothetical protein
MMSTKSTRSCGKVLQPKFKSALVYTGEARHSMILPAIVNA